MASGLDVEGRIWTSAADGVHCYHPDGTLLGKVLVPSPSPMSSSAGRSEHPLYLRHDLALFDLAADRRSPHLLGDSGDALARNMVETAPQRAVQPPSISSVCPVISDAASEARNTTASATSRGSPMR